MTVKTNATPRPIVDSDHLNGHNCLNGLNFCRGAQLVSARPSDAILRDDGLICLIVAVGEQGASLATSPPLSKGDLEGM